MKPARLVVLAAVVALLVLGFWLGGRGGAPSPRKDDGSAASTEEAPTTAGNDRPSVVEPSASSRGARPAETIHDRRARDAIRERLVAAWGQAERTAASARPSGAYAPMPQAPDGGVDSNYIRERVRDDFLPMARECYGELLTRRPDAGGRLVVSFTIVGDEKVGGIIDEASIGDASTLADDRIATCFRESMMSMAFRPPNGAGKVTVEYPFELAPGEDDGGGP